jgi:hypothetical protein
LRSGYLVDLLVYLLIDQVIYNEVVMPATEIIFVVDELPEGGYEARALGQSIYTQADTFDALKEMVRDAVQCHFEEGGGPRVIRLHFVRDVVIPA